MTSLSSALFVFAVFRTFWSDYVIAAANGTENTANQFLFSRKCYQDLGCFSTGPPFYDPILRPISLLPADLKDIDTKFYLKTPSSKNFTLIEPNEESLKNSPYDKDLRLYVFTYGYLTPISPDQLNTIQDLIDNFQKTIKGNFILVDWSKGSQGLYPQAVANARVVGAQIAQLVNFLKNKEKLDPKTTHLIGISLGAHISGWAGERIPELGRISGLDPAGPYFRNTPKKVHLDKTDAIFVDNIHTNTAPVAVLGFGYADPTGDIDFYPNGGSTQPNCTQLNPFFRIACKHERALRLFVASVDNSECKFIGTQCNSYASYIRGRCEGNKRAEMGFHAIKDPSIPPGTKFYLTTTGNPPYCIKK